MDATKELLIDEKDFEQDIYHGFIINSTMSSGVPMENVFTDQVIERILRENLSLKNYTTEYTDFLFNGMAMLLPHFTQGYENEIRIISDEYGHTLNIRHHLDVERFRKADRHEALRMNAQLLLECVEIYLFDRDDFDGKKFHEDLKPLLLPIINGTRKFQDSDFVL